MICSEAGLEAGYGWKRVRLSLKTKLRVGFLVKFRVQWEMRSEYKYDGASRVLCKVGRRQTGR